MLKKLIYYLYSKHFIAHEKHPLFALYAALLHKIFGLGIYNYGGIKLTASPVSYLDRYIILQKNINPLVTSAISQYLIDGGVFLDVGAHHGVFSLLAAKNPKTTVFAFEPSPRDLRRLWKNLSLNPSNNINVLAYGLGDQEKQQCFMLADKVNPGKNSLPEICPEGEKIVCHFTELNKLLDDHLLQKTKVCKLDVEGQEMFILNSLRPHMELFKQCVFIVEISPLYLEKVGFIPADIYDFFSNAGFKSHYGSHQEANQWDDFFYHPLHNPPLSYSENIV